MADKKVTLTLGDFVFPSGQMDFAVPDSIPITMRQQVVNHDLVGGVRVIDAMGTFTDPVTWSGVFNGPDTLKNGRALETLLRAGAALPLTFSDKSFLVVITEWFIDFQRPYWIPYKITCSVVSNNPQQAVAGQDADINAVIKGDVNTMSTLGGIINNSGLTSAISTLQSAVNSVSTFANAAQSTINSVLAPLAAVQAQVKTLITSVTNTTLNITTLGGILPNNSIAANASSLLSQVGAFTQLPILYNLQSVAGRVGANLGSVNAGVATLPTAGGNLMQIAAAQYGDATQWPTLAKANGLTDPVIAGVKTLVVPPSSANQANGGVLVS